MSRRTKGRKELEERIGHGFAEKSLLDSALTHISALSGKSRAGSYQRLEFLGDHVLGLVVSDMLFRAFPAATEGELSRRLAALVRKETCDDVARAPRAEPHLAHLRLVEPREGSLERRELGLGPAQQRRLLGHGRLR